MLANIIVLCCTGFEDWNNPTFCLAIRRDRLLAAYLDWFDRDGAVLDDEFERYDMSKRLALQMTLLELSALCR